MSLHCSRLEKFYTSRYNYKLGMNSTVHIILILTIFFLDDEEYFTLFQTDII